MPSIVAEKLNQAVKQLDELNLDLWLTFVRETSLTSDPSLDLILGLPMTWHSAFLVSRKGDKIAIVGRHDADAVRRLAVYDDVLAYDESIRPVLRETVARLDPRTIALNESVNDPAADGLTVGMWRYLSDTFAQTPYAARFVPAEKLIGAVRGRKSKTEIRRIQAAIQSAEQLLQGVGQGLRPGQTEQAIAARLTKARKAQRLDTAWDEGMCPIVNAGPDSPVGHGGPGLTKIERGQLLHIDFGVRQDEYCSDLQRMWYFLDKGEKRAPDEVRRAWDACWGAVLAGAEVLKPGVQGWEVDAAARRDLVQAGYPEYRHALGHQLGRTAHDGATLLGPRWERYGDTPFGVVQEGNVFTLELDVVVPGRGQIGIEEDVVVTKDGIRWLSKPQRKLWLV